MCWNSEISFANIYILNDSCDNAIHRYKQYYHCIFLLSFASMQLLEGLIWEGITDLTKLIWPLIYWLPVGATLGMYIEKKSKYYKILFYM